MLFLHALYQQSYVVAATTAVTFVCPKCGIAKKSGKMSCCGVSGSWFGNCGSVRDTRIGHTWYEGLQACKAQAQSKTVMGQELSDVSQERNESSNGVVTLHYKSVVMDGKPVTSASSRTAGAPSTIAPANVSTAYTTLAMNYEPLVSAVTTRTSGPANMSTLTPVTTPARISMNRTLPTISMQAPVKTAAPSRGFEPELDIPSFTIFLLAVAFC